MAVEQAVSSLWLQLYCQGNWAESAQRPIDSLLMSAQVAAPGQNVSSIASDTVLLLTPTAQNYEWGRTGRDSEVRDALIAWILQTKLPAMPLLRL